MKIRNFLHWTVVILLLFSSGCSQAPEQPTSQATPEMERSTGFITLTPEQAQNGGVKSALVTAEEITESFQALGDFKTKNRAKSMVEAPVSGRVLSLLVEEGESVQAGQAVVRLESPELSRLLAEHHHAQRKLELLESSASEKIQLAEQGLETQAPLNQAKSRLQQARAEVEAADAQLQEASLNKQRLEKLLDVGIPSQQQVEQSRSQYLQALAQYQAARDEVRLAEEALQKESLLDTSQTRSSLKKREISADLHLAREELRHQSELLQVLGKDSNEEEPTITLRTPASGSVISVSTSVGEYVEAGNPLLQIVQSGEVYPTIWIPSSRVPQVHVGTDVTVFFSTESPGYAAKISWLAPELDPESRSLAARLELQDQNLSARAGIFIKADVVTEKRDGLVVPKSAITEIEGRSYVYVNQKENQFQRREIQVGIDSNESVEILSGLTQGERCAVEGVFLLKSYDLGTEGE
jgi:HlyD family secretion protein